jgi:prolipoprotein diacylglyceryltransferase
MSLLTALFLVVFVLVPVALSAWAVRALPQERWQMLAAVPLRKRPDGQWDSLNLTYYGLFNAIAYTWAAGLGFALLAGAGVAPRAAALLLAVLIAVCAPASSLVARWVERKRHTLTVGGASFAGILLAPWLIVAADGVSRRLFGSGVPVWPALASFAIAYAFGEGIGRLACISFGCCYGRPVATLPPRLRKWLSPVAIRFQGKTRKAAYASGLDGVPLIPIQAFTNALYLAAGTGGLALFAAGRFISACLLPLAVTQTWRILSEVLRADYRGETRFSAYQRMSVISLLYAGLLPLALPAGLHPPPDLPAGFAALGSASMLLSLQGLFVAAFLYTGRSAVTGSTIAFHVNHDRI